MSVSGAAVAVMAAAAVSYYVHHQTSKSKVVSTTSTSRDVVVTSESDKLEPWDQRWSAGKTAWHKTDVHASLQKYCDEYVLNDIVAGGRILIPLCGKTVDMVFLAKKRPIGEVVGIDGISKAIEEFIQEQSSEVEIKKVDPVQGYGKYQGDKITLLTGDFFNITMDIIGDASTLFDGVWDRGALVAIQPSLREQYIDQIGTFIRKPNGKYLIATVVRPNNDITSGPPFSIDETELRRLFGTKSWVDTIQLLDSHSMLMLEPWYKMVSTYMRLGNIKEEIYLVTTK
jgi:thiopurine S-methyltransferase